MQVFKYDLFFVKRGWGSLDKEQRKYFLGMVCCSLEAELSINKKDKNHFQKLVVEAIIKEFINASYEEKINLLNFSNEAKIIELIENPLRDPLCNYNINKKYAHLLLEEIGELEKEWIGFIFLIYPYFTRNGKYVFIEYLKKYNIGDYIDKLSISNLSHGLLSGAVEYSVRIREILKNDILAKPYYELDKAAYSNPVYLTVLLYVWGIINRFELKSYDSFCNKSLLLLFALYPQSFPRELYKIEWKELLKCIEYRKYYNNRL